MLQNFQYGYDRNSNIETILDYVMSNPQTQQFAYDNLDRLTSAGAADGTEGNYGPEGYSYDAATGNLAVKGSSSYNYGAQSAGCPDGALDKAHAAVAVGGNSYCYDFNGNMVRRTIGGVAYTLTYDAENHMIGYSGGSVSASFLYDGDGRRVQSTVNGVTTKFVGSHVEWQSSTSDMVRYYYAGGARVAMRTGEDGLVWLVGDHLGSTSIAVADASGVIERQGYKAFGETRFGSLPTKYQYTGQRNEPEIGLYYYGARWYDSSLARFSQSDTVSPRLSYKTEEEKERVQVALTVDFSEPETAMKLGRFNWDNSRDQSRYVGAKEKQNAQASHKTANANLLENDQSFETNKFFSDQILDSIRATENLFRYEYKGEQDGRPQRNRNRSTQDNNPTLPMHPLSPDRYAYARSCPTRFTDPTGHSECDKAELVAGLGLLFVAHLMLVGIPFIVISIVATPAVAGPIAIAEEETIMIPIDGIVFYMIYDSNCLNTNSG